MWDLGNLVKVTLLTLFCFLVTALSVSGQSYELADGVANYQQGNFEQAIHQLQRAVDKDPMSLEAYYYLAASHMGLKKHERALAAADSALGFAPDNIQMLVVKAEALYHLDYQKAIPVYRRISELAVRESSSGGNVINKDQVEAYLAHLYKRQANDAFLRGNNQKAIQNYQQARNLTPDSLSVHNNLAYILIQDEKWDEAIENLDIGLEKFPTSEQLLFLKGQAHRGAGNRDEMVEAFKLLYELYPDNVNYGVIYGQALMSSNQARKANEHMNRLIEKYPDNEQLYEALKSMSEQRFDMGSKKNVLKLQRQAFPNNRLVALELADTHILLKEYEEARSVLDSIMTADPSPEIALRSAQTTLYDEIDDEALRSYRQVRSMWPDSFMVLNETARVFRAAGHEKEALDLFEEAFQIQEDPMIAIHIIELTDQNDSDVLKPYIKYLKATTYYAMGEYFELKFLIPDTVRSTNNSQFISTIVGLLNIFSEKQSLLTQKTERVLEGNASPKPDILQERRFTEKLNNYIDAWYELLKNRYPPEVQINILENALDEYPSSSRLYYFRGVSAIEAKKQILAKSSLEESIRYGAKDEKIHLKLGDIYANQGDTENAILFYERSLSLNKENDAAYRNLISLSEKNGKLDELCDRWLIRFKNNSEDATLKQYLISALHKADRFEEARRVIESE